jgi:hypothetical protein
VREEEGVRREWSREVHCDDGDGDGERSILNMGSDATCRSLLIYIPTRGLERKAEDRVYWTNLDTCRLSEDIYSWGVKAKTRGI